MLNNYKESSSTLEFLCPFQFNSKLPNLLNSLFLVLQGAWNSNKLPLYLEIQGNSPSKGHFYMDVNYI